MDPDRLYAEIERSTAIIAGQAAAGLAVAVPTCPGWTLRQLATHVGRAHRWATEITATRSAEFIDFRAVPDGKLPADASAVPAWLAAGSERLVGALRAAGAAPVWAFGELVPASFWARRMAHETMVHAADARLAGGGTALLDPEPAADAIDEWLTVMSGPLYGRPDPRLAALPQGRSLRVSATSEDPAGSGEWLVRHSGDGVTVQAARARDDGAAQAAHAAADVTVAGPAGDVLLVLVRRLPPAAVQVRGDARLLDQWLSGTPW